MKTPQWLFSLAITAALLLAGCSEQAESPLASAPTGSIPASLAKPIVHSVNGSGLLSYEGKNLGARYAAHEFIDGTFDGEYEINGANATGDPTFKWNGNVISFLVYQDVGSYDGKMAVFFGREKTGPYADWYDVFFAIDNGVPGQASGPDQVNFFVVSAPTLDYVFGNGMTVLDFYALGPNDLISILGVLDCERGNITVR